MPKFVHVRELKNQTSGILRQVVEGATVVVTRRGKPVATLKPFDPADLQSREEKYPTSMYDSLREWIESKDPELAQMSPEERRREFERITRKIRKNLPSKTWQEMDAAMRRKGLDSVKKRLDLNRR